MLKTMKIFVFCLTLLPTTALAENVPLRNPFIQPPTKTTTTLDNTLHNVNLPLPTPAINFRYTTHPLSYSQADEVKEALSNFFAGKLAVDRSTNSLLFWGSPTETKHLRQLLQEIDKPTQQVTLEAKIIALSQEDGKQLGINWQWDNLPRVDSTATANDRDTESSEKNFDGNWRFWRGYSFRFSATLNALITSGKARILATPRIITIPGREASIFIGDHIPVQTEKYNSSGTYTATEYVDAGIKLKYLPIISQNGKMVTASVHTEVSTPTLISELKNYRITSRTADTNVRMYSGETLVIGGLINEEEQHTLQKVPLLSNIPLLGELFKNRTKKRSKVEVLMLLTPHITEAGASPVIYGEIKKDSLPK